MAERRMFAKTIIDSDAFLDMPLSAQALYFHLSMRADDDGFINNPKKIQRMVGASDDDCKLLIMKRFIITFESGVIVIKHWKIHNYIQKDRYKPTIYQEEKKQLTEKGNKAYTECIHNGYIVDTQDRLEVGKESIELEIGEDKIGETVTPEARARVNYEQIKDLFNDICISLPRVTSLSDKRKQAIKARLNKYTVEQFKEMFTKAEASTFLKGGNNRNWQANFDWLIKDSNFVKVLDGNYDDKKSVPIKSEYAAFVEELENEDLQLKTAGNDEETRLKAEALKRRLAGE